METNWGHSKDTAIIKPLLPSDVHLSPFATADANELIEFRRVATCDFA